MNKNTIGTVRHIEFPYTYTTLAGEKVTENFSLKVRAKTVGLRTLKKIQKGDAEALGALLSDVIVQWDLKDDDEPVSPTPEVISSLPVDFLVALTSAMMYSSTEKPTTDWPDLIN
jgi:hypothetical protein